MRAKRKKNTFISPESSEDILVHTGVQYSFLVSKIVNTGITSGVWKFLYVQQYRPVKEGWYSLHPTRILYTITHTVNNLSFVQ